MGGHGSFGRGVCTSHTSPRISHPFLLPHRGAQSEGQSPWLCKVICKAHGDSGTVVGRSHTSLWVTLAWGWALDGIAVTTRRWDSWTPMWSKVTRCWAQPDCLQCCFPSMTSFHCMAIREELWLFISLIIPYFTDEGSEGQRRWGPCS